MKLGIHFNHSITINPDAMRRIAQRAESLGFHSLWVSEHIAVPVNPTTPYPYGKRAFSFETIWCEAFSALAFLAAVTERIRLGTSVLPQFSRDPLTMAKSAASIDRLSNGRFELGLGAGYLREEATVLGHPSDFASSRLNEAIEIYRKAWSQPSFEHKGRFWDIEPVGVSPSPFNGKDLPIWIGGHGPKSLETTENYAVGNILGPIGAEEVNKVRAKLSPDKKLAYMRPTSGRTREEILAEAIEISDLGIDQMVFSLDEDPERAMDELEWCNSVVRPQVSDTSVPTG